MVIDLQAVQLKYITTDVILKNDDKLNDWANPMIAFSSADREIAIKYMETHKLSQRRNANLYHFSLYQQGTPISSVTLTIADDIARIDDVATLPEFQGKGYATSLITYVLLEAKKKGVSYCFLESLNSGLSIYRKLGFKALFTNNIFK